jgi:hypothetical protein
MSGAYPIVMGRIPDLSCKRTTLPRRIPLTLAPLGPLEFIFPANQAESLLLILKTDHFREPLEGKSALLNAFVRLSATIFFDSCQVK